MKTAILCDSLVVKGGAERVLNTLLSLYPKSHIFTSVLDDKELSLELLVDNQKIIHTSFIQKLPFKEFWQNHYTILSPLAFELFDFSGYDMAISLSSGFAKGIITGADTFHLGIVLTPPRYLWGESVQRSKGIDRSLFEFVSKVTQPYLRICDSEAGKRPDSIVAISKHIQSRVKDVYDRSATVIYPGVDIQRWTLPKNTKQTPDLSKALKRHLGKLFYLVVSRLHDYKKIDLAIKACGKSGRRLYIIGDGPKQKELKILSKNFHKIVFLGYQPDNVIRTFYHRAQALIFPGIEDFGLTPVEAMCCGTPVIAYDGGGVAETVKDGVTGILFKKQSVKSLITALNKFEKTKAKFNQTKIRRRGAYFSNTRFINNFERYAKQEYRKFKKT